MTTKTAKEMSHVENIEHQDADLHVTKSKVGVSGTVQLTVGRIVYVPAPTADPRGLSFLPRPTKSENVDMNRICLLY